MRNNNFYNDSKNNIFNFSKRNLDQHDSRMLTIASSARCNMVNLFRNMLLWYVCKVDERYGTMKKASNKCLDIFDE